MEAGPAEGGQQQAQRGSADSLRALSDRMSHHHHREQQLRQAAHRGRQRLGGGSGGGGVTLCVVDSKYEVVKEAGRALGMRLMEADDDRCNIYWVDTCVIGERFARMAPWQRINHFPGMAHIARKNRLAQNLATMRRRFPREYAFFPKTWVLPHDATDFRAQFDAEGRALARGVTYIVKPENSSKGRGIFLTKSLDAVAVAEPQVAQVYISRPLLLDGFKFDIRMYALVASCSPLRVYKYTDGLVRLCTSEYARPSASNMGDRFMHLTNSAINRLSDRYRKGYEAEKADEEGGSKRSLRWFLDWVRRRHGEARAAALWKEMGEICVKTVLSILPTLVRDYKALFGPDASVAAGSKEGAEAAAVWGSRAFELLGFDIMVDQALKPWLIEVNTLPSFATDSQVDCEVKRGLITETLSIVQAHPSDRRVYLERKKDEATQRLQCARLRADRLTHALQDEANVVVATRRRIEELFARHAPERMGTVERLMSKNKGREASLLCHLLRYFRQYGKGKECGGGTLGGAGGGMRRQGRWQGQWRKQGQDEWGTAAEGEGDVGYISSLQLSGGGRREAVAVETEAAGQEEGPVVTANGTSTSTATSVAAGRNLAAVATEPLTEAEEMARLANFARIYPPPPGQPDTYAPLVEHVWEKEHKLLRGHTAATRLHATSLGKGGGASSSGSDEETLRRRLISRLSCGMAAEGGSEQPDDASSLSGSSSAASIASSTSTSQQQRQEALAVLDLLGKTKPLPGRRRSEADDTRLDRLLLSLVSDDRPSWRRSGSSFSCTTSSSSTTTTSTSLPSPVSPIKARQTAAAARLSRGYSSREEPPAASARLGVAVEGGLAGRVRANEQRAQERRQGLRCRHAGRTRPPAGVAGPLPGFALLKPMILDLSVLEGGMGGLSIPVSDRGCSRPKQSLSMHAYY